MYESSHPSSPIQGEIYLDANATTKVLPEAAQAAVNAMELSYGNPSSSHITGLKAKHLMEETRDLAIQAVGAGDGNIIFTSGATEGIQTAVLSALVAAKESGQVTENSVVLYGATEHKAVPNTIEHWNQLLGINAKVLAIPVDDKGILDMAFIAEHLPHTLLICTMAVNNETGVYQDLSALNALILSVGKPVRWMVDCVQGLGKLDLALEDLMIDYAPFSGHKLYAPKGIGFLYIKEGSPFTPVIAGGGQESGMRSGTENIPGMTSLKVILSALVNNSPSIFRTVEELSEFRLKLAGALEQAFPEIVYNNDFDYSVPTTINFAVPGFASKEIMDLFDAAGIRVSSGSACSSKVTRSFVLDAMGLPVWQSESAIRMSFGPAVTAEEIEQACQRIVEAGRALQQSCLVFSDQEDDSSTFGIKGLLQLKHGGSCSWLYCDESSKECIIIDPLPALAQRFDNMIRCRNLTLKAVLDTHGHADHLSCRPDIQNLLTDVIPEQYKSVDDLGWPLKADDSVTLADGKSYPMLTLGEKVIINAPIPGHTDDSIAFLIGNENDRKQLNAVDVEYFFGGDTILMGTLGRTNFENSDSEAMYESLNAIATWINESTLICPAHDYQHEFTTDLATETKQNSMLANVINQQMTKEEFVTAKAQLDKNLVDKAGCEIICGAYEKPNKASVADEITPSILREWIGAGKAFSMIDIREPHEHSLTGEFPFQVDDVTNVPLTRIVQCVHDLRAHANDKPVVFICRSGSRSKLASSMFRRLGFNQVTHIIGGYALS